MPAERIARSIVRCAGRPRPEVVLGGSVRTLGLSHALFPVLTERAVARGMGSVILGDEPHGPDAGNLFEPQPAWSVTDGDLNEEVGHRAKSGARRLAVGAATGASVLGPGLLGWLLLRKARR